MQLTYRALMTDANGIEYSIVKTHGTSCLCLQGGPESLKRLKKAYQSSLHFYRSAPDSSFEALSVSQDSSVATALFSYADSGFLADYLKVVSPEHQYSCGRKLGRALSLIHSEPLSDRMRKRAELRHGTYLEHLASYMGGDTHFSHDRYALDAISMRYERLKLFRGVIRYGSLRHDKILVRKDGGVLMLPSYSFGPGDLCEDFASLETESAGLYPVFCAGVIDGYFKSVVPPAFWMHFAMYSALYALWKCGQKASRDHALTDAMQKNYDRICSDFDNFTRPVPKWYTSQLLKDIRDKAIRLGL